MSAEMTDEQLEKAAKQLQADMRKATMAVQWSRVKQALMYFGSEGRNISALAGMRLDMFRGLIKDGVLDTENILPGLFGGETIRIDANVLGADAGFPEAFTRIEIYSGDSRPEDMICRIYFRDKGESFEKSIRAVWDFLAAYKIRIDTESVRSAVPKYDREIAQLQDKYNRVLQSQPSTLTH